MAAYFSTKPATEQAVKKSRDVTVEAGILLKPLAQTHLHWQSDHDTMELVAAAARRVRGIEQAEIRKKLVARSDNRRVKVREPA